MPPRIYKHGSAIVVICGSQCTVHSANGAECRELDTDSNQRGHAERQSRHGVSGLILAAAFSHSGRQFALATDCKQLLVFSTDTWNRTHEFHVAKKSVTLLFHDDDSCILVADKFGDVFKYSLAASTTDTGSGELVLGHLSMILDAVFLCGGRYLATCDRDEKIRVTHYPQSYDIQSYCLGHTKMVTRLSPADNNGRPLLLSGAADGSVRLWDYVRGVQLSCLELASQLHPGPSGNKAIVSFLHWVPAHGVAVIMFEGAQQLSVLHIVGTHADVTAQPSLQLLQVIDLDHVPWHVCLDGNSLLVLQSDVKKPLLQFTFGRNAVLTEVTDDDNGLKALCSVLRNGWEMLTGCDGAGDFYAKLEKMGVDNLPDYLEKKRERLQAAKDKRDEPQAKICKTNSL